MPSCPNPGTQMSPSGKALRDLSEHLIELRPLQTRVSLTPVTRDLTRDTREKRRGHRKVEAEAGVVLPQARHTWSPSSWRRQEGPPPRASRGSAWPHLGFRLWASRTVNRDGAAALSRS